MPVKLISSGSGSVILNPATTAVDYNLTLPAVNANVVTTGDTSTVTQAMLSSGIAGNGPAFSAYLSPSSQSVSGSTYTKVQLNAKEFDTANCFDNVTNYRFTPNVAGYYQINGAVSVGSSSITRAIAYLKKNGNYYKRGNDITVGYSVIVTSLVYLNGSTDYVELFGYVTATTPVFNYDDTYFNGYLVRAA